MSSATQANRISSRPPAAARSLQQPGPPAALRINSRVAARARHLRLQLQPGRSLYDALVRPLAQLQVHSASITLLGGAFDALQYCVSVPDPAGRALLTHSTPIDAGAGHMVVGNATLARGVDGRPLLHCHAALRDSSGRMQGGHLIASACIIGSRAITALVLALDDFRLQAAFDPETRLALVQPRSADE